MCFKHGNMAVRGGALYYVIFVVFVLSAVTLMFIIHRSTKLRQLHTELDYFAKIDNLSSALTLCLSQPDVYQRSSAIDITLFEDSSSLVHIATEPHGLLEIITASTHYRGMLLRKSILCGKDPYKGDSIALYVPDQKQTLYASGDTRITGNAVIPVKGLQRASIEGRPLIKQNPVKGRISKSNSKLPDLSPTIIGKIKLIQNVDSIMKLATNINKLYQASVSNPYTEQPDWYCSESDYQISGIHAQGRIGFLSSGTILIRDDARLDGVLVSASKIIIEGGFTGSIQVFAKDSLVVGPGCKLKFPSVLCLSNDNVNPVYIGIGKSATIEGSVIVFQSNLSTRKPFLSVAEDALIIGQVYHKGLIELHGKIAGSLFCEGFYLKTKRAYYENHLLDNEIDFSKLPKHFVTVDIINGYNDQVIDYIESSL